MYVMRILRIITQVLVRVFNLSLSILTGGTNVRCKVRGAEQGKEEKEGKIIRLRDCYECHFMSCSSPEDICQATDNCCKLKISLFLNGNNFSRVRLSKGRAEKQGQYGEI